MHRASYTLLIIFKVVILDASQLFCASYYMLRAEMVSLPIGSMRKLKKYRARKLQKCSPLCHMLTDLNHIGCHAYQI